jgi:hypothetical protein
MVNEPDVSLGAHAVGDPELVLARLPTRRHVASTAPLRFGLCERVSHRNTLCHNVVHVGDGDTVHIVLTNAGDLDDLVPEHVVRHEVVQRLSVENRRGLVAGREHAGHSIRDLRFAES